MNFLNNPRIRKWLPRGAAAFLVSLAAVIAVAAFATNADAPRVFNVNLTEVNRTITPQELADWFVQGKRDFEILDLRSEKSYERGHIKNAISCPTCHASREEAMSGKLQMPDFRKKIVVYTQTGKEEIRLARILSRQANLYHLEGGYDGWEAGILNPGNHPEQLPPMSEEQRARIISISNYFLGKSGVAIPPPVKVEGPPRKVHLIKSGGNRGC